MNLTKTENYPIPAKRSRLSVGEENAVNQLSPEIKQARRWLCNELVYEICHAIPTMSTLNQILLTSLNIDTYLASQFRKLRLLIYGEAIAFLEAKLHTKNEKQIIWIEQVPKNSANKTNVTNQCKTQSNAENFVLETNHFRVRLGSTAFAHLTSHGSEQVLYWIGIEDGGFKNIQMYTFLRLIAPLIRPIGVDLSKSMKPTADLHLLHLLDTQRAFIDSVRLFALQFNMAHFYKALAEYNELEILDPLNMVDVPKLVNWLTTNNEGRPKKCSLPTTLHSTGVLNLLFDEIRKDFICATSTCRFVLLLTVRQSLIEFTLRNGAGEKLKLRCTSAHDGDLFYKMNRFPIAESDDTEQDECLGKETRCMTKIVLK